jgi:hypothetical protein
MAFHLDFDDTHNLITVSTIGSANREVRLAALCALSLDRRFRNDYDILCRFLDNKYAPERTECVHLGLTLAAFFRGQKIALVVGHAESARLKESVELFNSTGRVKINVFNSVRSAKSWLFLLSQLEEIAA